VSSINFFCDSSGTIKQTLKDMKRVVKECRRELRNIESITLSHSKEPFTFKSIFWPYAMIEIEAKGIQFQVAFKTMNPDNVLS
jgi:hypothetical protein